MSPYWFSVRMLRKIAYLLLHLLFGVLWIFGTVMEWNRRESHSILNCSDYLDFRVGAARTDTWHCPFSRDWKWRRHILCIQCTLYRALFWRVNCYISTYTYYMLFERQGWAKSTSKNVAKAYVDIQITANHYTLYYANN
jgi:hypothetical protein